ncbi:MAG TPA: WG repeat-containing protein [bacterium]|nr:WG repeat-containing protein [Ignavibacteriaceae bacterium]HMZ03589.1 WG repeat-containing protein [bacterium]HND78249.1 WG repeat-containing protein [bacterium]HNE82566.1 WG repeat-containing protein [bacterium]HNH30119.1 WG repeat-containing protein [bacterium]
MKSLSVTLLFIFLLSCTELQKQSLDIIPVKSANKWGYISIDGKFAINPQFSLATYFVDGIAMVRSIENKVGYIGKDGKYIINPVYAKGTVFSEGLACVALDSSGIMYIDKSGQIKINLTNAEFGGIFSEGLAPVALDEKYGFIDQTGTMKINPQFDDARFFKEGMASVAIINEKEGLLWGFVNAEGKTVINPQFKEVGFFQDGLACISNGEKIGYVDKAGIYTINPQFDIPNSGNASFEKITAFYNGTACFRQGREWGFIDKQGKIIINPQFSDVSMAIDGVAPVASSNGSWGYVDKEGKYVINPQFSDASPFWNGNAFVKSGGKYGIIGTDGKFIVNPQFDMILWPSWTWVKTSNRIDFVWVKSPIELRWREINERIMSLYGRLFYYGNAAVSDRKKVDDFLNEADKAVKEKNYFQVKQKYREAIEFMNSIIDSKRTDKRSGGID